MHIFFTRHGESQANIERIISNRDLPHQLTVTGRAQAATLAARLATANVATVYSSPIPRAHETGQIVAEQLQVPLLVTAALREWDCGIMEGRGDGAAWAAHGDTVAAWAVGAWNHCIPGGESFADLRARFVPFVQRLIEQSTACKGDLLLITHGSLLYHMLPLIVTNIDSLFLAARSLPNCLLIETTVYAGRLICSAWPDEPM